MNPMPAPEPQRFPSRPPVWWTALLVVCVIAWAVAIVSFYRMMSGGP